MRRNQITGWTASWLIGATVLTFVVEAGAQEKESAPVGLQGILPAEVPDSLTEDSFTILGPNWEDWSRETVDTLLALYASEEPLDRPAQQKLLDRLQSRVRVMKRSLGDPQYTIIRDPLITLHGRISRRLELANAILATLDLDAGAAQAARLTAASQQVNDALNGLEAYLKTLSGGVAWLDYVQAGELRSALGDPGQLEQAYAAASNVSKKLKNRGQLTDDVQKAFLGRSPFLTLDASLDRLLATAALNDPNYVENLRARLADLVAAIETYEASNLVGDAGELKTALQQVRAYAPDNGDRIEVVVRTHYLNYNLQALVSEELMAKMVSDNSVQYAPVRDFGLGAHIRGWQTTRSSASFDLKPSDDGARFEIIVDGQTHSNTLGITDQATIRSIGDTTWRATKSGTFDGEYFTTTHAMVSANPRTTPVAASTNLDWVPILGGIARGIALDEARNRGPQARAFAAQRTIQRVAPELDNRVDKSFSDATHDLQTDLFVRLKNAGLYSQTNKILSTDEMLRISSRVGLPNEPAGAAPETAIPPGKGITLNIHESLLNNGANRLKFHGRTMTELQVREELSAYFTQLTGKTVDLVKDYNPKQEGPNIYVFDANDPIRFKLEDGEINLVIRAAFREEGKEDIPAQVVTVPLVPRLEGENIIMERGQVKVAPVERPDAVAVQVIRAGIIRKKLETAFEPSTRTRRIELTRKDKPSVFIWVMRIKSLNGWISVWAE